jgi:hypothetical protein
MHPLEATQHCWPTPPHRHERVDPNMAAQPFVNLIWVEVLPTVSHCGLHDFDTADWLFQKIR